MITIKIRHGQDPNKAFQKLKNILINEGLFEELKKRKSFVKASKRKKIKKRKCGKTKNKRFS